MPIEHPELSSKRGRKPKPKPALTERERRYVEAFDAEYEISRKHIAAVTRASELNRVSLRTIEQAVRKRRKILEIEDFKRPKTAKEKQFSKLLETFADGAKLRW